MSNQKILIREIAEKFLKDGEAHLNSLAEFTSMEDDVATALTKHKGSLGLHGISTLSKVADLLQLKSTEWLWPVEKEKAAEKGRERKMLESLATIEAPREFQNGRIVLTSPKQPLAEAYRWKPDFEGEDYATVLHFYEYLYVDHVGSITDSNGYLAKSTTPEAADLYRNHRAF